MKQVIIISNLFFACSDFKEKDGLSKEEYDEMYQETISEMTVFQKQMESMLSGNMTLLNEFQAAQMVFFLFF